MKRPRALAGEDGGGWGDLSGQACDIGEVRSRLVDRGLCLLAGLVALGLTFSVARAIEYGWHPVCVADMGLFAALITAVMLRGRLSYGLRACVLLGMLLVCGAAGLLVYGLAGGGFLFLIAFAAVTAVVLGARASVIAVAVSLAVIAAVGACVCTGINSGYIDAGEYVASPSAWMVMSVGFALLALLIVGGFAAVHRHLQQCSVASAASEKLVRSILETAPSVILRLSADHRILEFNPEAERLYGRKREEVLGVDYLETFIPAEARELVAADIKKVLSGRPTKGFENSVIAADGCRRVLAWDVSRLPDVQGRCSGIVAIGRDVTSRRRAEEALQEERDRVQTYLDVASVILVAIDFRQRVTLINRMGCSVLGWSEEEITGKNWFNTAIPRRERERVKRTFARLMAGDVEPVEHFENPVVTKNGEERIIAWHNTVLRDRSGSIVGALGSGEDVTQRRRAEKALRESEEIYKTLVETSPDAVTETDLQGHIIYASPQTLALHGYQHIDELAGRSSFEMISPEDRQRAGENLRATLETGITRNAEYTLLRKDGTRFAGELSAALIRDSDGNPKAFMAITRDVTERKRAENLIGAQRELGVALSAATTLEDGLRLCVEAALDVSETDSGGVYLVDESSGALDLVFDQGLSPGFVGSVSHYDADSVNARLVTAGDPVYTQYLQLGVPLGETDQREGLRAIGVLPIHHEDRVIGCLNIASHTVDEVPVLSRVAAEAIAAQIGGAIARLKAQEMLRQSEHELNVRNRIAETFLTGADDQMYAEVLRVVLDALGSKYGVFGYVDQKGDLVCPSMTRDIWDQCEIPDKDIVFAGDQWGGTWGRALKEKTTVSSTGPFRVPRGHIPIHRSVATAIAHRGEVLGLLHVANKATDYDEKDIMLLETIADHIAPVLWARMQRDLQEKARKRAEKALHESLQASADIVRSIPAGLFIYQYQPPDRLVLLDANPEAQRLTGRNIEQWRGRDFQELWPEAHQRGISEAFTDVMRTGRILEMEDLHYRDDRLEGVYRIRAFPMPGDRLGVAFEDVAELKRAEETLREREETIRALVETSRDWIWAIDAQGVHTYSNPAVEDILGYRPEELIGKSSLGLMHEDDRRTVEAELPKWTMQKQGWSNYVLRWRHKRGGWRYLESNAVPVLSPDGEPVGFRGVDRDVTERHEAEERLHRMEKQLAHVSRLSTMGEMVAGITHEVNQPFYSILNFAKASRNLLAAEREPKLDDLREWIEEIAASAAQAGEIIRRLRGFVRRTDPVRSAARLGEIIADSLQLIGFERRQRQVCVTVELADGLPDVNVDRVEIEQVMVNLLQNAWEAMQRTEAQQRLIVVGARLAAEEVEVSVADNGPGLPTEIGLNLFDAFVTTKPDGLGMGLAISRTIVEAHGGRLWPSSNPGGGTVLRFTLPIAQGGQAGAK